MKIEDVTEASVMEFWNGINPKLLVITDSVDTVDNRSSTPK